MMPLPASVRRFRPGRPGRIVHLRVTIAENGSLLQRFALELYECALPLYRAVGDRGGEALALNNMGHAWDVLGEKRKALELYERVLPLARAVGDRRGEAMTLNNMAAIYYHQGNLPKAAGILRQIIPIMQDIGAVTEEATFGANLAMALYQMRQTVEAIQKLERAIAILRRHNLLYDGSGVSVEQYEAVLTQWRS